MTDANLEADDYVYPGEELALFAHALNWKNYLRGFLDPHLRGDVLEVGAGIGETTRSLCDGKQASWVCAEPDPKLAETLRDSVAASPLALTPEVHVGELGTLDDERLFDTVIYIDVLEHIERDREELLLAAAHVRPGGAIVVLSPAHPFLYTVYDESIGHYRRYTTSSLRAIAPPGMREERMLYLDSFGMLASLGNKLLLRSSMPTAGQVAFWDKVLVRISTVLDPLLFHKFGRSVLAVWRRD